MPISKKLHFMHIPKTGGTSLFAFIDKQFEHHDICPSYYAYNIPPGADPSLRFSVLPQDQIKKYKLFMHHLGWLPRIFFSPDEIETITFLRDPIERMLSEFDHYRRDSNSFPRLSLRWKTFEEYIFDPVYDYHYKGDMQTRYFCADLYLKSDYSYDATNELSTEFLHSPFGYNAEIPLKKLIDLAIERLHGCAFVGVTEDYEQSFERLCEQYLWLPPKNCVRLNVTPNRTRRDSLSSKALDRALELNQLDMILYKEALNLIKDKNQIRIAFNRDQIEKGVADALPQASEVHFTFADKMVGENWHIREGIAPKIFSWSSGTKSTLLFSIKKTTDLFIKVYTPYFLISGSQNELTLTANSYPIPLFYSSHPDGGWIFGGIIPVSALSQETTLLEIGFSLPEIKRPCDVNSESYDMRSLGFACMSVDIIPSRVANELSIS